MTDIEKQALALVNETSKVTQHLFQRDTSSLHEALCRAIERHEAFRQEVSDAMRVLEEFITGSDNHKRGSRTDSVRLADGRSVEFSRFIIAKPDPLVEALNECGFVFTGEQTAVNLRAALAARGLKIVEVGHD